jgi:hypothetical protein
MKSDLLQQYDHFWKVFTRLVNEFDDKAWINTGRKATIPAKLSFHILHATQYYIKDTTITKFESNKSFEQNIENAKTDDLPSISDILQSIKVFSELTKEWLKTLDIQSKNEDFTWAGNTKLGIALFLLKHNSFHLGELSSLLNESKNGEVGDNYVAALQD